MANGTSSFFPLVPNSSLQHDHLIQFHPDRCILMPMATYMVHQNASLGHRDGKLFSYQLPAIRWQFWAEELQFPWKFWPSGSCLHFCNHKFWRVGIFWKNFSSFFMMSPISAQIRGQDFCSQSCSCFAVCRAVVLIILEPRQLPPKYMHYFAGELLSAALQDFPSCSATI